MKIEYLQIIDFQIYQIKSLTITADDVKAQKTSTTIYWEAEYDALFEGESISFTNTGTAISDEFPQNTSETETVTRTITYTLDGLTATTTIIQDVWINMDQIYDLNSQWVESTKNSKWI